MTVPRSMRDLETTGDFGCKINKDAPSFIRNAEAAGSNPVTPIFGFLTIGFWRSVDSIVRTKCGL